MPHSKPPENAILLGPDTWIEHIDLTGRYDAARDIDELLVDLEPMWSALETYCVAGCCGIDAFDFSPDAVRTAAEYLGNAATICADLNRLRDAVNSLPATVYVSSRLNNYCDKAVFDALLAHLQEQFSAHVATIDAPAPRHGA